MTWLFFLVLAVVILFLVMRKKSVAETAQPALQHAVSGVTAQAAPEAVDDMLPVLIAAAIAEYEADSQF